MRTVTTLSQISKTIHKSRWDRVQRGMAIEEVAKQDHVKKQSVELSIRLVELYRVSCSPSEVEVRQAETLMVLADEDAASIKRGLNATVPVFDDKGKKVSETPDHVVQLEASREYGRRLEMIIPKRGGGGGGNNVNVNLNTQNNVGVLGRGVVTFEDRLREIQHRRGLVVENEASIPSEVSAVDELSDAFSDES